MCDEDVKLFVKLFQTMAYKVHASMVSKGFWEEGIDRDDGQLIALLHTELSEAYEAVRGGNLPDDKIPGFTGYEAELADCVIRIMDMAVGKNLKVGEAIAAKIAYNKTRSYKHGKQF